jgi:hypothetical protein
MTCKRSLPFIILALILDQALVVFEQESRPNEPGPRLEQGEYVLDYKGYEIHYPRVRIDTSGWTVNLASNDPRLLNRLGGQTIVIKDHQSLEGAIAKAKGHIDALG